MAGLMDILGLLGGLGGGMQPQQGMLAQNGMQQSNPLRELSLGLLKANQPSRYKKSFGGMLGEAVLNADESSMNRAKNQAEINKSNAMTNLYGQGGQGGSTLKATQAIMEANPGMDFISAYSIAKSGVGQGNTMKDGAVAPLDGNLNTIEDTANAKETGTNKSDLKYKPIIKAGENQAESGAKSLAEMSKIQMQIPVVENQLKNMETKIKAIDPALLGPIRGQISYYASPQIQALSSTARTAALELKNLYNMGSQGFTDKDRDYLDSIVGGAKVDPIAAFEIFKDMRSRMAVNTESYNQASDYYKENNKLTGFTPRAPAGNGGAVSYQDYFK